MSSEPSADQRHWTADVQASLSLRRRKPWLAALLSLLCVGVGQLYNGSPKRALGFFAVFLLTEAIALLLTRLTAPDLIAVICVLAVLLAGIGLRILASIDALRQARRIEMSVLRRYQRGWIYAVAILVTIAGENLIGRPAAAWKAYSAPSASMAPTIQIGDYFLAERDYFHRHIPRRGDLAIFPFPRDRRVDYVKRIVGLPGDRIELRDSRLYINGTRLEWRRVEDFAVPNGLGPIKQYIETQPDGASYRILQMTEHGPIDNFPVATVPPDHYFVLGDNRDNSADSREVSISFIAREDLSDRPYLIYWSAAFERIGTKLQ